MTDETPNAGPVKGDGKITIPADAQGDGDNENPEKETPKMDLPEGVMTVLLKTGTESHLTVMGSQNAGINHNAETLRTMSNLKLNEVGPIEARSAGRILDGPFPSTKTP